MLDLTEYPTLNYAYAWSTDTLARMTTLLASLEKTAPDITIAAASGSLGRLEGMAHSDCDLIVLIRHEAVEDPDRSEAAMQEVWQALEPLEIPMPKASGIYATAASQEQLCNHGTLGHVTEDKNIFGKRLQVLLDARPVYGQAAFRQLQLDLLNRYAAGFLIHDQSREWVYLLNDLIRYLRAYCAWHQFDLSSDPVDSWYMRNTKLRNCRIPMFAALLFLLGECSKQKENKIKWLHAHLDLTMLERLRFVYQQNNDNNFPVFLGAYEYYMKQLNNPDVREMLVKTTPVSLDVLNEKNVPEYNDLYQNSKIILSELTRFTLARQHQWSDAFFEYLLF